MSLENLSEQQALIPIMRKLMKVFKAIIAREFKAHKIGPTIEQAIVLKKLCDKDGRTKHDLTLLTSRDKTALTRLLSKMESKKLIRRKISSSDKRVNLVYITIKGQTEIKKTIPLMLDVFSLAV